MPNLQNEGMVALNQREHHDVAEAKKVVIKYFNSGSGTWDNWIPTNTGGTTSGTTSVTTQVGDSATVVTLKASNTSRVKVVIVNTSTAILYVKEGSTATASDWSYRLENYDVVIIDDYNGIVTGIWASDAGGNANVTETT